MQGLALVKDNLHPPQRGDLLTRAPHPANPRETILQATATPTKKKDSCQLTVTVMGLREQKKRVHIIMWLVKQLTYITHECLI